MREPKQPDRSLLACRRLPAVVHVEGAAALLGFTVAQVALLTAKGYIPTVGRAPKANCVKLYATEQLLALDAKQLSRCVDYLYRYHAQRNGRGVGVVSNGQRAV
jgi:hypothetical protein